MTGASQRSAAICVGTSVEFSDQKGKHTKVKIVQPFEANPADGRLSAESPVAKALLGHKAGDRASCRTPSGVRELDILTVS